MRYALLAGALLAAACQPWEAATEAAAPARDLHTLSNADSIRVCHLDLDIRVDFTAHRIEGSASWHFTNPDNLSVLRLDTDGLTIDSVTSNGRKVPHTLDSAVAFLGSRLNVPVEKGDTLVRIWYKTAAQATALQWLEPAQTLGKKQPFLYTQSEPTYARTGSPAPTVPASAFRTPPV